MAPPKKKRASGGMLADNSARSALVWGLLLVTLAVSLLSRPFWLGLLIALVGICGFVAVSFFVARSLLILPYASDADRMNGWLAFLGWMLGLHRSSYLVENVTTRRTIHSTARLFPGVVLVDGHSAVVTRAFNHHYRVLGPGVHFRQTVETVPVKGDGSEAAKVREVVDLRRQFRIIQLKAQTRDGMFMKTMLYAIFQIDRDPDKALDGQDYFRFYDAAVHNAVLAERVGPANEIFDWTTVPLALAQDAALQIISTYELDELYAPRENRRAFHPAQMRRTLGTQISDAIREQLKSYGIQLIAAGVTKIEPADGRVTAQRVLNWRATRQQRVVEHHALAEATAETMREEARNKVHKELLYAILIELANAKGQSRALLQLRLAAAFERIYARSPAELPVPALLAADEETHP